MRLLNAVDGAAVARDIPVEAPLLAGEAVEDALVGAGWDGAVLLGVARAVDTLAIGLGVV